VQIFRGRARRGLALSWGLLWFAAAHAPNTGILLPINALVSEHWMYLPTIGLFLGAALGMENLQEKKLQAIAVVLAVVAALSLGAKTYLQNRVWRDPGAFYENILSCGESTGRVHNNLGLFYWSERDFDRAIVQLRLAVENPGMRMEPMIVGMHTNLALMYLHANVNETGSVTLEELRSALPLSPQTAEAIGELQTALKIDPDFMWANQMLTVIYDYQGDRVRADFYRNRLH
jgi:Tfp pilus assembly protein PilF